MLRGGVEQHADGTDTTQAWINLALALGLPGRGPGNGWGTITGQGNGQGGREHGQKADQLPGYRSLKNPAHRAHVAAGRARIQRAELHRADFGAERFDTVFAVNVDLLRQAPARELDAVRAVLRPRGRLVLYMQPPVEAKVLRANKDTRKAARAAHAKFVITQNLVCADGRCPLVVERIATYRDVSHISITWAHRVTEELRARIRPAAGS